MKVKKHFLIAAILILHSLLPNSTYTQSEKVNSKDGVEISFIKEGAGDVALIFVHGWSCDKSYWSEQVKEFAAKYTVVTIDLAGHGESGLEKKNYTVQAFGEDVAAAVNHLKLNKVILIGHSMGGPVVLEAANILGDNVVGIVGADTFQNMGETYPQELTHQFLKPFQENFKEAAKGFVKSMFPENADSILVAKIAEDMSSAPPTVALSAMENLFMDNGINVLDKINVPIISINCDRYPIKAEENKKRVKSYKLKMMKDVGHFVMLEDPKEFNKLLQESIDELTTN